MQKAWVRLGIICISFGTFFYVSLQILISMDSRFNEFRILLDITIFMMIVMGIISLINAFQMKGPTKRKKRKQTADEKFLSSLR